MQLAAIREINMGHTNYLRIGKLRHTRHCSGKELRMPQIVTVQIRQPFTGCDFKRRVSGSPLTAIGLMDNMYARFLD